MVCCLLVCSVVYMLLSTDVMRQSNHLLQLMLPRTARIAGV